MATRARSGATAAPHSWDLEHWPLDVYPHNTERGRYIVRAYREELLRAGALTRVGRELVVIGDRYTRWLQARSTEVPQFAIGAARAHEAPNR